MGMLTRSLNTFLFIIHRSCSSGAEPNEMYEFIPHTSSEETLNTSYPSDVPASDNNRTLLPPDGYQRSVSHEYRLPGCRTLAKWKKILRSCRYERTNVDQRKNNGYLMVERDTTGFVLVGDNAMDQNFDAQATRSGVECEHWHSDALITNSTTMTTATTASTSSTNSLNTEYKDIDRSILADTDYGNIDGRQRSNLLFCFSSSTANRS